MNSSQVWFTQIWDTFRTECDKHPSNVYGHYAKSAFGKKWTGGGTAGSLSKEERDNAAITTFKSVVNHVHSVNDRLRHGELSEKYAIVLHHAKVFLEDVCMERTPYHHDIPDSRLHERFGVGPGSSQGATGESFLEKIFFSPLTSYPHQTSIYRYYLNGIEDTTLKLAEQVREHDFGHYTVKGSKASFVEKTSTTSRMIATEAIIPMGYQLSLHSILTEKLKRIGLDLANQQFKNRSLAKQGSIDGQVSTIDLSSASDTISLALVEMLFESQKGLLFFLKYFRSEIISINDEDIELPMLSTMGNGYTFVVETLVFLSLVFGLAKYLNIKLNWRGGQGFNCGVYGDDIIVPTCMYNETLDLLTYFGFIPNKDKCYTGTDPFRESCGGDYHHGMFVRGVYLKTLSSTAQVYSAINRLVHWSTTSGIPIPDTLSLLMSRIQGEQILLIPMDEEISSGLRVPKECLPPNFSKKLGRSLSNVLRISPVNSGVTAYCYLKPVPKRIKIFYYVKDSDKTMQLTKRFSSNPEGVLQSVLKGCVRGISVSKRIQNITKYEVVWGVVLSWDYRLDAFRDSHREEGYLRLYASKVLPLI